MSVFALYIVFTQSAAGLGAEENTTSFLGVRQTDECRWEYGGGGGCIQQFDDTKCPEARKDRIKLLQGHNDVT
jgi:hypothetical protein